MLGMETMAPQVRLIPIICKAENDPRRALIFTCCNSHKNGPMSSSSPAMSPENRVVGVGL